MCCLLACLVCLRRRTRSITNDRSPGWSVLRCCHGITQGQLGVVDDLCPRVELILKIIIIMLIIFLGFIKSKPC